jgi:hypothetical protein
MYDVIAETKKPHKTYGLILIKHDTEILEMC